MTTSKIIVVIPTYNEAENLVEFTSALLNLNLDYLEILIVDDASPDGTGQIADQLALQYPNRFYILHRPMKMGLGSAYTQGFTHAIKHGAMYIIQMDADFSHSPDYIPEMLKLIPECDVVVGSRYINGGKLDKSWNWYRRFLSWWANSIWVRLILGIKTHDATSGFKCWKAKALVNIDLDCICSNGYIFQVEMCYLSEKKGYNIKEIPIYFEDRRVGHSKMNNRIKIESAVRVFEIKRRYRNIKPIYHLEQIQDDSVEKIG